MTPPQFAQGSGHAVFEGPRQPAAGAGQCAVLEEARHFPQGPAQKAKRDFTVMHGKDEQVRRIRIFRIERILRNQARHRRPGPFVAPSQQEVRQVGGVERRRDDVVDHRSRLIVEKPLCLPDQEGDVGMFEHAHELLVKQANAIEDVASRQDAVEFDDFRGARLQLVADLVIRLLEAMMDIHEAALAVDFDKPQVSARHMHDAFANPAGQVRGPDQPGLLALGRRHEGPEPVLQDDQVVVDENKVGRLHRLNAQVSGLVGREGIFGADQAEVALLGFRRQVIPDWRRRGAVDVNKFERNIGVLVDRVQRQSCEAKPLPWHDDDCDSTGGRHDSTLSWNIEVPADCNLRVDQDQN